MTASEDDVLADQPVSWPVQGSEDLYRDGWVVAMRADTVEMPTDPQDTFRRLVVEHPGAVVVLAMDEDERVFCLRQYRHAASMRFVELPAGLRDAGDEPPVETAARELREEAELAASDWRPLLSTFPSAGLFTEVHEIFLARGLSAVDRGAFTLEHEEADMETFWVPFEELLDAVLAGQVRQGPLVQAVLAYQVLKARGEL